MVKLKKSNQPKKKILKKLVTRNKKIDKNSDKLKVYVVTQIIANAYNCNVETRSRNFRVPNDKHGFIE